MNRYLLRCQESLPAKKYFSSSYILCQGIYSEFSDIDIVMPVMCALHGSSHPYLESVDFKRHKDDSI